MRSVSGPRQIEFRQFRIDDALAFLDLFQPLGARCFGELFEGIDVVEINLLDFTDGGIDVARDGDVDEEQRAILAGSAGLLDIGAADNRVGRAGGAFASAA